MGYGAREKGRGLIRRAQLRRAPCEVRCASRARSRCLRGSKNTFFRPRFRVLAKIFFLVLSRVLRSFLRPFPLFFFFASYRYVEIRTKGINYRTTFPCDRVVSQPPHEFHEIRERGWIESDIR